LKIAFVLRRFPVSSETFVLNQITGLLDRGHDVEILVEAPGAGPRHTDVERYNLITRTTYWPAVPAAPALRWMKGAALLARLALERPSAAATAVNVAAYGRLALTMNLAFAARSIDEGRRYDVIHCHFGENGNLAMALRDMGILRGRLVTAFHAYDLSIELRKYGEQMYSRLFQHGELFLPISERWRRKLIELGCPEEKIAVHRMGIDPNRFAMRTKAFPAGGTLRLVSVARLVEKKGIEYGIRAVAQLASRGQRIMYTVIGDGPLAPDLRRLTESLGVTGIVQLVGARSQPEVVTILSDAHLFIAPSCVTDDGDEEGIPVVIMEAMAMGLPVIATRHSGIPELVEDGVSGFLTPERDVDALARLIARTSAHPDQWQGLGAAGRRRVLEHHDIERLNDVLVERFQHLLA
jgi:colanic acid/amylovoran/stewartan biosynthesis glycosyltransferase WcaL/AmsK/CpsK